MTHLRILVISLLIIAGIALAGCGGKVETQTPAADQIIEDVTAQEAYDLIQQNQGNHDFVIIDVRTPAEFDEGHIENALNVDFQSQSFKSEINEFDRNKKYLIYCRSGNRSRGALAIMVGFRFKEVYHLSEGIVKWINEGYPVAR